MNDRCKHSLAYHVYKLSVVSQLSSNKRLQFITLKKGSLIIFIFNIAEPRMYTSIRLSGNGGIFERGKLAKNLMTATLIVHIGFLKYVQS